MHFYKHTLRNKGFTLIEVLMVIAIVSLLSSVILATTNVARAKARDASKKLEIAQVKTAIEQFIIDNNRPPKNYLNLDGTINADGLGRAVAYYDPASPTSNSSLAYEMSFRELVDGGYLSDIPDTGQFGYYDYGVGFGAHFFADLEAPQETGRGYCALKIPFEGCDFIDFENYYPGDDTGCYYFNDICVYLQNNHDLGQEFMDWCSAYVFPDEPGLREQHVRDVFKGSEQEGWARMVPGAWNDVASSCNVY